MLKWLYNLSRQPLPIKEPEIGDRWIFSPKGDPWGPGDFIPVKILDVRDGWVRYDMNGIFRDERMEIKEFMSMYKLVR